ARLDRLERRVAIEGGPPSTARPAATERPTPAAAAPGAAPSQPSSAPPPAVEPRDAEPVQPQAGASAKQDVATPAPARSLTPDTSAPAPERETQPAPEPRQGSQAEPAPAPGSALNLVEVRRLWPDLLDAVKLKRRYTWILLSQNAQVAAVDDKTMTIALVNAGARNSFVSGGSEEILRQAAIDVIGHDWRIEAIVDPSAQPGAEPTNDPRVVRPAVRTQDAQGGGQDGAQEAAQADPTVDPSADRPGAPTAEQGPRATVRPGPVDPGGIANARGAIQPTRAAGSVQRSGHTVSDDDVDRDDPDADAEALGGAQLLERELGARVIEEIKHD
ncbi:MAG: hypothetical protein ACRDPR_13070, partial [Nocardioidaceae bacterium]